MIMIWHWDDVNVNKQEDKEIAENIILWSDDIFKNWDKNKIEI